MRSLSLVVIAMLTHVTRADCQQLPVIGTTLDSALSAYVAAHAQTPEEYVLGKFRDHDVVFLGEFHKFKQNVEFLHRLIPLLYRGGVYTLAYEFARREDQPLIDSLLAFPAYDEQLARLIAFRQFVHWPFQEYVDVYKVAWQLNRSVAPGGRKFRILGVNDSPDWSLVTKPEDRDNYQIMSKVWKGSSEEEWGKVILDSVVAKGEKALVYSGTHHAFTEYRQPKVYQGRFIEWGDMRMGNAVFQRIGKRAIMIALHAPWYSADGWERPWVLPADGYLDAFFSAKGAGRSPIGFDTRGTPFGRLPGETGIYKFGYKDFMLEMFCDGYVYMCPFSAYEPVTLIQDFVNEENLAVARSQSPDPSFRSASVADFETAAREALDFRKRLPKY